MSKIIWNEGVYYRVNRVIIQNDGWLCLRNTWTGQEKEINLIDAKLLMEV